MILLVTFTLFRFIYCYVGLPTSSTEIGKYDNVTCCFSDFSNKTNKSAIQYDVMTQSIKACYSKPSCLKLAYINQYILKPFKPLTRNPEKIFTRFRSLCFNPTIISCKVLIAWGGPFRAAKFKPHLLSNPGFMLIALSSLTEFSKIQLVVYHQCCVLIG